MPVVRWLCQISLEPGSCVRRIQLRFRAERRMVSRRRAIHSRFQHDHDRSRGNPAACPLGRFAIFDGVGALLAGQRVCRNRLRLPRRDSALGRASGISKQRFASAADGRAGSIRRLEIPKPEAIPAPGARRADHSGGIKPESKRGRRRVHPGPSRRAEIRSRARNDSRRGTDRFIRIGEGGGGPWKSFRATAKSYSFATARTRRQRLRWRCACAPSVLRGSARWREVFRNGAAADSPFTRLRGSEKNGSHVAV